MRKWFLVGSSLIIVLLIILYIWLGVKINQGTEPLANGQYDSLIILGAKVKPGGIPSLSLKNRLDISVDYLQKYPHVNVIVSGGMGPDEDRTEASVMFDYLVARGIEASRIQLEDASTSTYENLAFSMMLSDPPLQTATIVSNDFHLYRAKFLANQLHLEVDVLPATTPSVVEFQSRLRERAAILKAYLLRK